MGTEFKSYSDLLRLYHALRRQNAVNYMDAVGHGLPSERANVQAVDISESANEFTSMANITCDRQGGAVVAPVRPPASGSVVLCDGSAVG